MLLKVDLQCSRCYKKVKKVICKFPQIRDQVYDEKNNIVIIKVFCCDPERIRDKLCARGCGVIKSIEIRGLDPEPEPERESKSRPEPEPQPEDPPPEPPLKKNGSKNGSKNGRNGSKKNGATDEQPPTPPDPAPAEPDPPKLEEPVPEPEPVPVPVPVPEPEPEPEPAPAPAPGYCCGQCYAGQHGGPCYYGYGGYGNGYGYGYARPPPPPPAYDPYNYYGYNKGYCVTRCGECISDESATSCTIM